MATLSDLKPDKRNARRHTVRNLGVIESSLQRDGFGRSVLLANDGTIIAGNATIDAAASAGIEDVLVVESDGTKVVAVKRTDVEPGSERFHLLALADNRAAELAEWDESVLAGLRDELDLSVFFADDELAKILSNVATEGLTNPDDVPAVPDEPVTKQGDLWLLGRHRLLCGDSTVATDVERLLGGATPRLMVTDPPYGVELDQGWRDRRGLNGLGRAQSDRLSGDNTADWYDAWVLSPADVIYVWSAAGALQLTTGDAIQRAGYELRQQIVWVKTMAPMSRSAYHWKHEPCWYAVRKGKQAGWIGDRKETTIWEAASPKHIMGGSDEAKEDHPTQKPVECMQRPIRNHEGDVFDPFLGSGTTLIAAEQLNRTCYGMEIDPHYCDVIVKRWQDFTGQTAELEQPAMAAD